MPASAFRRIAAFGIDWLLILGWAGCVAAVGIPLYLSGTTAALSVTAVGIIATTVLVVPVTIWLAWLESGRSQATIGKRALRLKVTRRTTEGPLTFGRALVRNALKIALPWTLGHAAALQIAGTGTPGTTSWTTWLLTAAAYLLPLWYVVSLFVGAGLTAYDRTAETQVVPRELASPGAVAVAGRVTRPAAQAGGLRGRRRSAGSR
ncbi:MAG: RDD family protein [Intrasporangium sp.]|uniref:RDD family protein n=1 Tax=Intrasporangium sp. TaxID=1925024 RepID=UPI002648AA3C|nr:RDD family protein [Intrasporangium sp.]MDN5796648.1 RDD family protein [Intrasporangium sp.]